MEVPHRCHQLSVPVCWVVNAGVIKLAVVQEDVPQLLSIGLLEHGGAIIDTNDNKITFAKFGKEQLMTKQSTGHRTIDITRWPGGVFPVPEQLTRELGIQPGAFNKDHSEVVESYMSSAAAARVSSKGGVDLGDMLLFSYIRETLPPKPFLGWTRDVFCNDVLVSLPRAMSRGLFPHVGSNTWKSTWFCSDSKVINHEFFSSCESNSNGSHQPVESLVESTAELCNFLTKQDFSFGGEHDHARMLTVFHQFAREDFEQDLRKLYLVAAGTASLPRSSSHSQGASSFARKEPSQINCCIEHGGKAAQEACFDQSRPRGGAGSLVLDGAPALEDSCRDLHSTAASTSADAGRCRTTFISSGNGGELLGDHIAGRGLPTPPRVCDQWSQSTRDVEALSSLPFQARVCALRSKQPEASYQEEEQYHGDLRDQGCTSASEDQEKCFVERSCSLMSGVGADDGRTEPYASRGTVQCDEPSHGSSDPGATGHRSELDESQCADAGAADDEWQRPRDHLDRRGDGTSRQGRAGSSKVSGLAFVGEALNVSLCKTGGQNNWFVAPCNSSKQSFLS